MPMVEIRCDVCNAIIGGSKHIPTDADAVGAPEITIAFPTGNKAKFDLCAKCKARMLDFLNSEAKRDMTKDVHERTGEFADQPTTQNLEYGA